MDNRQNRQRKINEVMTGLKNAVNMKKYYDNLKSYNSTMPNLRGATANNIMQPTQTSLSQVTPTINNGATSLAGDFTSSTMPTNINSVGAGTGINTLGATSPLNAGAGLSNNLGTFGTAAASEASGASTGLANLGNIGANIATTAGGDALAGTGTGVGSALGGSTAAGTAGGLGAVGAGLSALAPVGAAAGLGLALYNMIAGAKKEKDAKAMQMSQQAAQQSEQIANQGTQQAMNNLQQGAEQKKLELANEVAQNMQPQGLLGDLSSSVSNPALQQMALNNQTNPQPVEQVPVQASPAANIADGVSTVANTAGLTSNIMDLVGNNAPQPIVGSVVQEQPIQNPDVVVPQADNESLKNGLMQNVKNGWNNLMAGFAENNSTKLSPENFGQDTYTTQERAIMPTNQEVDAYANELRKNGVKDDIINAYLTEGKNSGNKEIADWVNAHQDLRNEDGSWKPTEVVKDVEHKKDLAYRLGEGLGTLNRIASNPITQGLAATAFNLNDGQSLGYSLGKGLEYGANKARSDAYRKLVTGDDSASLFGGYSEKDLNALSNQEYKRIMAEVAQGRLGETTRHNQVTEGQKDRQIDMQYELGKERNAIAMKNSATTAARLSEMIRHNRVTEYLKQQKTNNKSGYDAKEFNSNLGKYAKMLQDPNTSYEQKVKGRMAMISEYGEDFIKLEKKLMGEDK